MDDPFWAHQMSVLFWFLSGLALNLCNLNRSSAVIAPTGAVALPEKPAANALGASLKN
jgi:hypothetical protein